MAKSYSIFEFVLYPDSTSYDCEEVIEMIKDDEHFGKYAMALHDKDYRVDEETGEVEPIKPHYHVMCQGKRLASGQYANATIATMVDRYPGVAIERGKTSFRAMVRYLVHADSPGKHLYPTNSISSNFAHIEFFKDDVTMFKAAKIANYIFDNKIRNTSEMMDFVFREHLYDEFRRGMAVWRDLMRYPYRPGEAQDIDVVDVDGGDDIA